MVRIDTYVLSLFHRVYSPKFLVLKFTLKRLPGFFFQENAGRLFKNDQKLNLSPDEWSKFSKLLQMAAKKITLKVNTYVCCWTALLGGYGISA